MKEKIKKLLPFIIIGVSVSILFLMSVGTVVKAVGMFDETISASNLYSKYPLANYQLDFQLDDSVGWLDVGGKIINYALYYITQFIWTLNLYISNAVGYVIQQAFALDFVNDITDEVGKAIQTLAGVSSNGLKSDGLVMSFFPWIILITGIFVVYVGVIKHQITKSFNAIFRLIGVFILGLGFVAGAPTFVKYINELSSDIGTTVLSVASKITLDGTSSSNSSGDSADVIRDNLFAIQIYKPWLLLQYGDTDLEVVGESRVEELLSTSPSTNNGDDRAEVVTTEVEERDNGNMSVSQTTNRLGTTFFLLIVNIAISFFVILLSGIKLFAQFQFVFYVMLIPISCIMSMIPNSRNTLNKTFLKLFNTIMMNAGIIIIITIGCMISSLVYNLADTLPFFMIGFLQAVVFAGTYLKLNEFLDIILLRMDGEQQLARRVLGQPARKLRRSYHRISNKVARRRSRKTTTSDDEYTTSDNEYITPSTIPTPIKSSKQKVRDNTLSTNEEVTTKQTLGSKIGEKVGNVIDLKSNVKDKVGSVRDNVKNAPTNVKYEVEKAKDGIKNISTNVKENVKQSTIDFTEGIKETKQRKSNDRQNVAYERNQKMNERKEILQKKAEEKANLRKVKQNGETSQSREHVEVNVDSENNVVEPKAKERKQREHANYENLSQINQKEEPKVNIKPIGNVKEMRPNTEVKQVDPKVNAKSIINEKVPKSSTIVNEKGVRENTEVKQVDPKVNAKSIINEKVSKPSTIVNEKGIRENTEVKQVDPKEIKYERKVNNDKPRTERNYVSQDKLQRENINIHIKGTKEE